MRSADTGSLRVYQPTNFTACPSSGGPSGEPRKKAAWRGSDAAAAAVATAAAAAAAPVIKTFKAQPAPSVLPGCDMGVTRL